MTESNNSKSNQVSRLLAEQHQDVRGWLHKHRRPYDAKTVEKVYAKLKENCTLAHSVSDEQNVTTAAPATPITTELLLTDEGHRESVSDNTSWMIRSEEKEIQAGREQSKEMKDFLAIYNFFLTDICPKITSSNSKDGDSKRMFHFYTLLSTMESLGYRPVKIDNLLTEAADFELLDECFE